MTSKKIFMRQAEKREAIWLACITADLFSLGGHWIYDLDKLKASFPNYDLPQKPLADSFHQHKKLGDQTHYGDQARQLWQYLADHEGHYDPGTYRQAWLAFISHYGGYMDKASKDSLAALKAGQTYGSLSDELGASARIAAVYAWIEDPDQALFAALDQSRMTHNSQIARAISYLLAQSLQALLDGAEDTNISIFDRLEIVKNQMVLDGQYDMEIITSSFAKARDLKDLSAHSIAKELGQSCHASHGLPALLAVLRAGEDYVHAMQLNLMIGGDSAARAMIIGALLGAKYGSHIVPPGWSSLSNAK